MNPWRAVAVWDGQQWRATVQGLPGGLTATTLGRDRDEALSKAKEAVHLLTWIPEEDIDVDIDWKAWEPWQYAS